MAKLQPQQKSASTDTNFFRFFSQLWTKGAGCAYLAASGVRGYISFAHTMKPHATPVISATVNNALILFFVGLFFFIAMAATVLIDVASESFVMKLVVSDNMTKQEADTYIAKLMKTQYARKAVFVTKAQALEAFKDRAEVKEILGEENPLPTTIELHIKPEYLNGPEMEQIAKKLVQSPEVFQVYYPKDMIERVLENRWLFQVLAAVVGLLLITVAFFLIVNTIRLSIYSRRLVIRSMQLIGATAGYIRAPYLRSGMIQGTVAGIVASALIFLLLLGLRSFVPATGMLIFRPEVFVLYISLILFGGILGWFSSTIAVNRFLNKNLDEII